MRDAISACVTAGNEEKNIRRCLESVKWADEVIVVDSFSTDRTVEIAREFTERVYSHEWMGYIGQKNLIRSMATTPWVLFVDADEEISDELREEILDEFETGRNKDVDGYEFPRMVSFLGKWIRHGDWYPDRKLRLFRKEHGECAGVEPHDQVIVEGPVKQLKGHLCHYTYNSIREQVAAMNKFSTITAQGWYKSGRPFRLHHLLFRPPLRFLRSYVFKHGFMEGLRGLMISTIVSYGVFVKYSKLWEAHTHADHDADESV